MSLEILRKIEQDLATATGKGASFRLGDFFDYIGGTSTGAIIAGGLAMGKSVQELIDFYIDAGPLMFEKTSLIGRLRSFYQADPLRKKLNSVFRNRTLDNADLRSLLLIVTRNATTDRRGPSPAIPLPATTIATVRTAIWNSAVAAGAGEHRRTRLFSA